jgi:hypothetical protein
MTSNLPFEIINMIFSYSSSPTARLIKNFIQQVQEEYEADIGDYNHDADFRFAVWSNGESDMIRRFCIQDAGIVIDEINY